MNTIRRKMRPEFQGLQGGLFSSVKKADVGTAVLDLMANGVDMLCWADPFFPDPVLPEHISQAVINRWKMAVLAIIQCLLVIQS